MKKRVYLSIIMMAVFVFSLGMGFLMQGVMPIENEQALLFYWITKGFVLLMLIGMTWYVVLRKQEISHVVIALQLTLVLQMLPLAVRFFLSKEEPSFLWASIIVFVVLVGYLAILFSVDVLNDKVQKVTPTLEGKRIPVVDEASYDDSDGRFKGAMDKKVK